MLFGYSIKSRYRSLPQQRARWRPVGYFCPLLSGKVFGKVDYGFSGSCKRFAGSHHSRAYHNSAFICVARRQRKIIGGFPDNSRELLLRVSDNGVGLELRKTKVATGLGFIRMQERLRSIGGELAVWSAPTRGTRIEARAPLSERNSEIELEVSKPKLRSNKRAEPENSRLAAS